ncbi:hypothetical protein A2645_00660, partial [Candidatus Nomurabacteria bacterium RIFCSPHIGHO2_01_FULL_39_9]
MGKLKSIYLDNAAATPLDPEVKKVFVEALGFYANPSALHEEGIHIRHLLEDARKKVASHLGAHSDEIIFTGSGTESNNLAIRGLVRDGHIVTTNIEHPSVLETCKEFDVTFVKVDSNGIVDPKKIEAAIKENTVLVSVMLANNEIGTIEPIGEIAKVIRHYRKKNNTEYPYFHTDAVQAINYLPVDVNKLGVDLITLNGSKIYGPKGVGVLYKKRGLALESIMTGGGQEMEFRPGTENLLAILGFAKALEVVVRKREIERERLKGLQNYFFEKIEEIKGVVINGDRASRLPNNVNISLPGYTSDILVIELSAMKY